MAAVDNLTKSLAIEWAEKGVRINSVAPVSIVVIHVQMAAVDNLTKSLAIEWAEKGVKINSVAPVSIVVIHVQHGGCRQSHQVSSYRVGREGVRINSVAPVSIVVIHVQHGGCRQSHQVSSYRVGWERCENQFSSTSKYSSQTGAARSAIDNLTKSLAIEWAEKGVRINSVALVSIVVITRAAWQL